MSKRFTDTGKWEKFWFRKLPPKMKCAWLFLCDSCDHAGVWDIDPEAFQYFIGESISIQELLETFGEKIELIGKDKLFLSTFIEFQYGALNPENRVHLSVLNRLDKIKNKPLISPLKGSKDKDKEKDKDIKEGAGEKFHDLIVIWNAHATNLSKVEKSNAERDKRINSIWKSLKPDEWVMVVKKINASDFCKGTSDQSKGWRATFDWLLQKETYLKVLEGKYDNLKVKSQAEKRLSPNTMKEIDSHIAEFEKNYDGKGLERASENPETRKILERLRFKPDLPK